jgi:hypothetical protein
MVLLTILPPTRSVTAVLVEWKPFTPPRGQLLGYAAVRFGGGWTVGAIPIFAGDDRGLRVGVPRQLHAAGIGDAP